MVEKANSRDRSGNGASSPNDFYIVAIGASAGGLHPLETFFANLPVETDAAFVVLQHLSPNYESLTPEILQRQTPLPVRVIENGIELQPGHIFVLPSRYSVILEGWQLRLQERPSGSLASQIDTFFMSLAQGGRNRIIGILLSGTGSDGTAGLRAIRRVGGIAMVQSPDTAQFSAMVENAISTGIVERILAPDDLAYAVYDITSTPALSHTQLASGAIPDNCLTRILALLDQREHLDFSQYKPGTLNRRIQHRMVLSKTSSLDDYIQLLEESPIEVKRLGQDLLIGSTRFFRDPELWDFLEQDALPLLLETLGTNQPLRLWVPACATGEEAYTLAIVANDVMAARSQAHQIKIFATDIDLDALSVASRGVYRRAILQEQMSEQRLKQYFSFDGEDCIVKSFLRDQVVFAPHDLTRNAGFSQMQIICCRNVLIYMQPPLQQQVLRLLHFSLVPGGLLVLGSSEGVGTLDMAFHEIEGTLKVFRRGADLAPGYLGLPRQTPVRALMPRETAGSGASVDRMMGAILRLGFCDRLATCVLLNSRNQILHVFLNSAQLLSFPTNEANLTITEMVPAALKLPLSTALYRVRRQDQPIVFTNIALNEEAPSGTTVTLRVGLAEESIARSNAVIVLIERYNSNTPSFPTDSTAIAALPFEIDAEADQYITDLEQELQQAREHLQAAIADLETTNEEYQATNEELLASNEELQSANEELQSLNEELHTLNAENQKRIVQLTELNADISNLLSSTNIGVIFLDQNLNIRRFTPAAAELFNLRHTDIGRPLDELTHHLTIDNLIPKLQQTATDGIPFEQEVAHLLTDTIYWLRLLPYCHEDGTRNGVVLTLINVDELKRIQRELEQTNALLENIYAASPLGMCLLDADQRYIKVNETLASINGLSIEQHLGRPPNEVLPELADDFLDYLQRVLTNGEQLFNREISGTTPGCDTEIRTWLASYYPVPLLDGRTGVGITVNDISDLKQIQADLAEQTAFATQVADSTPDIIAIFALPSGGVSYINQAIKRLLGYSPDLIRQHGSETIQQLVHPDDAAKVNDHFAALLQAASGEILSIELRYRHANGDWRWFEQRNAVFRRDAEGRPTEILGISTDITERLAIQQALEHSETLFRLTLEGSQVAVFTQDLDLRYTWIYNPAGGFTREEVLGKTDTDLLPPSPSTEELIKIKRQVFETHEKQHQSVSLQFPGEDYLRHYDTTYSPMYNNQGQVCGLMAVVVEVTEHKRVEMALEQARQQLEEAQRVAHIGSWQLDVSNQTITWSQEVFRIFGLDPAAGEPLFDGWLALIHPDDRDLFLEVYDLARISGKTFNIDVRIENTENDYHRHVNIVGKVKEGNEKTPFQLVGTVLDITERKRTEAALHWQAFYDQLTQLSNRNLFLEQLKLFIRRTQRENASLFAVIYLDVDGFKEINDTLGHLAGDSFLVEVARRLQSCIRPGDVVARLGGDEFAMILEAADLATARAVAERIQKAFAESFTPHGQRVDAAASIGIALYNPDLPGESDTVLLENADIAMYRAKAQGPGHIEVFDPQMRSQDMARIELKAQLKNALDYQEFVLHYQPIVELQTGRLHGFEALLRWHSAKNELHGPAVFLDVLQASHFMYEVEIWVLREAVHQLQQWSQMVPQAGQFLRISINLSPRSLEKPDILEIFEDILASSQLNPGQISIEITENFLINTSGIILPTLQRLREMGIDLALDDFGTGYSSLGCLHQLPISTVKVDRTFIKALDSDENLMRITSGISALSQVLNLQMVAEGIETINQLIFLRNTGCDFSQGYFFSRPLSAEAATNLVIHPFFKV
jgi:diguanylate cyclase (GGDEF)-like protein/PAS domain S-box-containing protein